MIKIKRPVSEFLKITQKAAVFKSRIKFSCFPYEKNVLRLKKYIRRNTFGDMRDLPLLIFQGLSGILANHFNLNTIQFWFYKRYHETASVVLDSKNDASYQMGSPLEKWITIYCTKTFFFLVQLWEMLTQSHLHCLVRYEQLPYFY